MRISDWSSDVCSSDLSPARHRCPVGTGIRPFGQYHPGAYQPGSQLAVRRQRRRPDCPGPAAMRRRYLATTRLPSGATLMLERELKLYVPEASRIGLKKALTQLGANERRSAERRGGKEGVRKWNT